jgi:hypothetical protein
MRWIVVVSLTLFVCLVASNACAGRIFGDIKVDGKPVPAGLKVKIAVVPAADTAAAKAKLKAAPVVVDSTVTDKFGSYKLTVKQEGKCVLTLLYEKQALTLDAFSYKEATRYDLIVEKKEGKLSLRRK